MQTGGRGQEAGVRGQGAGGRGQAERDPFEAVPVRNEHAEARIDRNACAQIRMRLQPKHGRSIVSRLAFQLGFHRDVRVDLDTRGSRYWELIDGHRNLGEIERQLRDEFGLTPEESRKATLQFTKMLMLRHLILLDLRQTGAREETAHAR